MKILVTAFEPFGGETLNASQEALRLAGATAGADIVKLILPVMFGESARLLEAAVQREAPDAVLCLGEAGDGGRQGGGQGYRQGAQCGRMRS